MEQYSNSIKFIDLFCGLGGIRIGFQKALQEHQFKSQCVLSSDIKDIAIKTYEINFNEKVSGDVRNIDENNIPNFDVLLAGFPCQAFSTAGKRMGFDDTRGTLFFEVARILKSKQPRAFILENVEGLVTHDRGKTLSIILNTLTEIGYHHSWKVLNSKDFGVPQNRKRIYIVGLRKDLNLNTENIFNFLKYPLCTFHKVRESNLPVLDSKLNQILLKNFSNLNSLSGKSITDKRGGNNNIHSWDLALKGKVSEKQKELLNILISKRRYKKWAIENGTAWFDGIPLTFSQIKSFINYSSLPKDLNTLVNLGYLKMDYPKDFSIINGLKTKVSREDLPLGYTFTTGKLSFEFNHILDDNNITPTIVSTDASKLAVIENKGLRKLSPLELKRLFGFPESYQTSHLNSHEIFDVFGNSVTVNVIENITKNIIHAITYKEN